MTLRITPSVVHLAYRSRRHRKRNRAQPSQRLSASPATVCDPPAATAVSAVDEASRSSREEPIRGQNRRPAQASYRNSLRPTLTRPSTKSTIGCRMKSASTSPGSSRLRWLIFLGFMAIIAYLLANGHTVHVLSALPFLIILACPVMMFFMMKNMNMNHGGQDSETTTKR